MLGQNGIQSLCLAVLVLLTDLDSSGVHQTSVSRETFDWRSSADLVIKLWFLSLHPVNILDSTEETSTEPGQVPGFPWTWPPFSGFSLGLFQFHHGKKVKPANNANGLDTKSIEDILFSFFWFNGFPSALGWWEPNPHTHTEAAVFLKGMGGPAPEYSSPPAC